MSPRDLFNCENTRLEMDHPIRLEDPVSDQIEYLKKENEYLKNLVHTQLFGLLAAGIYVFAFQH